MAEQKAKVVHGPGPRGMGGPRPKVENPGKLLKRIMAEVFQHYLPHCILVLICIVVSALANVQASLFLQTLIDDYIIPMTQQQDPSFAPLAGALVRVGCIYVVGILAAWLNARIMVNVTQGTLRNLRTQLFTHMESLPISYFDTHPHGDIMSVYTNDVDTLRQMLSQSIPQLVSSAITIVSVFASMCMLSWQLTIVTMLMVALMLFCSKKITQQSGKYFIAQQRDLGKVNGYIEEMMEGQKVVKVFTHEQKALEGFRELNDKLKDSAKQANSFANIMMPVNAQLGNISYAICALVGAAMAVTGMGGVTLGTVMAFLSLNKSFNMPISQVSMQANSIIMALAGAERIFKMMDESSETDEGYVTLINAKYDKDDNLVEANERTGIWAWKHPHHDGTTTYHKLEGDITFTDVDFGYVPGKTVLHDINLYGRPGQKIAFVGSTGAGKTTMLKIIMGIDSPDSGQVQYAKDCQVGYLEQETNLEQKDTTILAEVMAAAKEIRRMGERANELQAQITELSEQGKDVDALLNEYGQVQDRFEHLGGYELESNARKILSGLGFKVTDFERPCSEFSGGWQMRIALAKLFLRHPDLLLLDEPTNHLDLESVQWLRGFIANYDGAVLIVSHDDGVDVFVSHTSFSFLGCAVTARTGPGGSHFHTGQGSAPSAAAPPQSKHRNCSRRPPARPAAAPCAELWSARGWGGPAGHFPQRATPAPPPAAAGRASRSGSGRAFRPSGSLRRPALPCRRAQAG